MTRSAKISHRDAFEHARSRRPDSASARAGLKNFPPMGRLPVFESETARADVRLQSGTLAYRRLASGEIAVLLVSKRRSGKWGIPKGKAEADLSLADNAAKEAFEEAGVRGQLKPQPLGTYRALKRVHGVKTAIEVWVYLLEVTETAPTWPEQAEREIKWCSPQEAALLLDEPVLAEFSRALGRLT
jgi:8-oxo-dGTP pyrophosphatase MutT (NUDIX family)